jgi:hypothetical protein
MTNLHTNCPRCKQPLPYGLREGVYLPPRKTEIFDIIKANPGITIEDIIPQLSAPKINANAVRVHIFQINEYMASTDLSIRSADDDVRIRISGNKNTIGRKGYFFFITPHKKKKIRASGIRASGIQS